MAPCVIAPDDGSGLHASRTLIHALLWQAWTLTEDLAAHADGASDASTRSRNFIGHKPSLQIVILMQEPRVGVAGMTAA